jgi:hypothetical protein
VIPRDPYDAAKYEETPIKPAADSIAFSKWFDPDGSMQWRQCKVLRYDQGEDRYLISWPTGGRKLVSRLNLRQPTDDPEKFSCRLEMAE